MKLVKVNNNANLVKDDETGYVTANMIPKKGADPFAIKSMNRDIGKIMGHNKIILKSDQEPAILDLKNKFKQTGMIKVAMEESPVGDSQSGGSIENAIKPVSYTHLTLTTTTYV